MGVRTDGFHNEEGLLPEARNMKKPIKETIHAKGMEIGIYTTDFENEFISLTDIARNKSDDPNDVIRN